MGMKQIWENERTGALILSDSSNNHYKCNIYGDKLTEFLPGISGTASYQERAIKLPMANLKVDTNQYIPSVRKFEGYAHFPRPISKPFFEQKELSNNKDLNNYIRNAYHIDDVLKLFNLKANQGLPYLSSALTVDGSKSDRVKLLKIIDEYFEEYRVKNKYKLNLMDKDPIIKALRHFRNLLIANDTADLINNRKLAAPSESVKKRFDETSKDMKKVHQLKNNFSSSLKMARSSDSGTFHQKDEYSFLSVESENEKRYEDENINQFKGTEKMKQILDKEKDYISGYIAPLKKEPGIIRKVVRREFKNNGDFYLDNIALFKKGKMSANCS